jgi:uncharacterized caspase-like protein
MSDASYFQHGYALLIGVDDNLTAHLRLPDVGQDTTALAQVLTHPERCAYPADQVKVIRGADATRAGMLDGLDWLREQIATDANATAVVYYSGHGYRDVEVEPPVFYLAPYDTREHQLRLSLLPAADFAHAIAALNPRRLLVILDCCHAGGMGAKAVAGAGLDPTALPASSFLISTTLAKAPHLLAEGEGRAVLSSSQSDQPSYLRPDGKMSLFTYHLVEALTGHAQPAGGADEVLVSDLLSYVYRQVPASVHALGHEQTPTFELSGNFPVALVLGGKDMASRQRPPDPLAPLPDLPLHSGSVTAGARGVAVAGNLSGSIIVTGDHSRVERNR